MENIRKILADRPLQSKPFYVSKPKFAERLADSWSAIFPNVAPFYAVKCNDDGVLLKALATKGVNFDCASKNEIIQVLKLGVDPSRILFAHTIKSPDAILFAKEAGIDKMTFDGACELDKIKLYHPKCDGILRIRCDDPHALVKLEKYGAHIEEVPGLLQHAKNIGVGVIGVSFHVGSGSRNPDAYWKALRSAREVYDIAAEIGHSIKIIDIGGGMYADIEDDGEITCCVAQYVEDGIRDFFEGIDVKFVAEPGRFFAQHYSLIAVQIIGKRVRDGLYEYFINDSTYSSFSNCIYEKATPEPVVVKHVTEDEEKHCSVIYGCTCDGVDVINKQVHLPELHVDDWIFFEAWGAYTRVISTRFNGFGDYDVFYI
ncbi:ornithine decarboxylase [Paramecium bursaria Chlorella virus NE-JV-1]|nr:ornithine decarboxylase [Paramecium bursaria Chlorella virus NE-JV-1]